MKLTYRPEIDGLRAIAVGAVILYHAQITILGHQPFKGGFVGVDIFFVISGYLITSIILNELVTTGSFSFKHFYERRIRRILPALLFVMLASLPFAWMYLLPSSFIDFSKSILYSLGFSSNFYFHYSGQQYGAESGLLKPFLHTWSLSVEEQFYILFPIVLLVTFKYFRKHLLTILVIGLIISLQMADWGSKNYPSISFYFLHTRIWELLAGSILSYFEITLGYRSKNKILNLILPSIGLFFIGHSILFFNDGMFHPSISTLSPIIGACLIIWFSNKEELITKILSTKLFVGIGLISYSLYLWHYPIFAYYRILDISYNTVLFKVYLIFLILFLSLFSYFFVEKPARNKQKIFLSILTVLSFVYLLLLIFCFNVIFNDGFYKRFPKIVSSESSSVQVWNKLTNNNNEICFNNQNGCAFNKVSKNKKIYLVGDSTLAALSYNLKEEIIKKDLQFITYTKGGCFYFPGFNLIDIQTNKILNNCDNKYFTKLKKKFETERNSIIIFGGRFPRLLEGTYFNNMEGGIEGYQNSFSYKATNENYFKSVIESFKFSINEIKKNNKIILIYPIPEVGWNVPIRLHKLYIKGKFDGEDIKKHNYITTSYDVYKRRTKSSFELLDSIKGKNIHRVYPHTVFCNTTIKDRCVTHDNNNTFYSDDDHPSIKGAEMINNLIMKEIEKIELK